MHHRPELVNGARSEAARLIAERTPGELDRIFFTNGGADANEHAVRMARLHTGRQKVLSAYRSYHGGTQLAINITGDPAAGPATRRAPARSTSSRHTCTARRSTPPRRRRKASAPSNTWSS